MFPVRRCSVVADGGLLILSFIPLLQSLESKLASCRDFVNEQTANRRRLSSGSGSAPAQSDPSENHPTNGLYSKG